MYFKYVFEVKFSFYLKDNSLKLFYIKRKRKFCMYLPSHLGCLILQKYSFNSAMMPPFYSLTWKEMHRVLAPKGQMYFNKVMFFILFHLLGPRVIQSRGLLNKVVYSLKTIYVYFEWKLFSHMFVFIDIFF